MKLRRGAITASLIGALLLVALPAHSQTSSRIELSVERGIGGFARAHSSNPVVLTISSDRFFSGTIEIPVTSGGTARVRVPIEVPGGSRKQILVVVPDANVAEAHVVDNDGKIVASTPVTGPVLSNGQPLIGVLAGDIPPARVRLPALDLEAPVVAVTQELLSAGLPALRPLSHLVVDASMTARLSSRQREALTAFAMDGGGLVVATRSPTALTFLPAALRPSVETAATRLRAGAGEVVVVPATFDDSSWRADGAAWTQAIRPLSATRWLYQTSFDAPAWSAIADTIGRPDRISIGWLMLFVFGYVVVAGPATFAVLAWRKRRDLAWIVVPAVALLFTGIAYAAGQGMRARAPTKAAAVVVAEPGGMRAAVWLGTVSRGGDVRLEAPAGWIAAGASRPTGGYYPWHPAPPTRGATVTPGIDTTSVELPLSVGEYGMAVAYGATTTGTASAGRLTMQQGDLSGSVTNTTPWHLEDAELVLPSSRSPLGDLTAGEHRSVRFRASSINVNQLPGIFDHSASIYGGMPLHIQPYGHMSASHHERNPTPLRAIAGNLAGVEDLGRPYLIGWTDFANVAGQLGFASHEGRALVALPIDVAPAGAPGVTIERTVVLAGSEISAHPIGSDVSFHAHASGDRMIVRFTPPAGTGPRSFELQVGQMGNGHVVTVGPGAPHPGFQVHPRGGTFTVPLPPTGGSGSTLQPNRTRIEYFDETSQGWVRVRLKNKQAELPGSALTSFGDILVRVLLDADGELFPEGIVLR